MIFLENCLGLWQWNTKQRIRIEDVPIGTAVSFSVNMRDALRRDVATGEDGRQYAEIPNVLLQDPGILYVYVHRIYGGQMTTVLEGRFRINPQPKPPDYVNDEDEVLIWEALKEQVRADAESAKKSAESAAGSAIRAEQGAANAGYMFFDIDENGDLIYTRTENVDVSFELKEGNLWLT